MKATDKDLERFWAKVRKGRGCWVWVGAKTKNYPGAIKNRGSYGTFGFQRKARFAHRWIYQVLNNVVLEREKLVCHVCDNSLCVRPDHLYAGTAAQNMADMVNRNRAAFRESCKNGHKRSASNTSSYNWTNGKIFRRCLECASLASHRYLNKINPHRKSRKRRRGLV